MEEKRARSFVNGGNAGGNAPDVQLPPKGIGEVILFIEEMAYRMNLLALDIVANGQDDDSIEKRYSVAVEEVQDLAQHSADVARELRYLANVSRFKDET